MRSNKRGTRKSSNLLTKSLGCWTSADLFLRKVKLKVLRKIPIGKVTTNWGVASNDSNEIFVSNMDNNRIVVLNEKGEFIRSLGHRLLNKPTGICIDNEGRIFVANRGNNKILLFNSKGEYITAVHNGESFKYTRGISLDTQGNLFVRDVGNQCVQFSSPNGSILKTIGKGDLRKPVSCLCHEDKVFVSDYDAVIVMGDFCMSLAGMGLWM